MFAVPKSSTMLFKSFCALVCKHLFTGDRPSLLLGKDLRSQTSSGFFLVFLPEAECRAVGQLPNFPASLCDWEVGKLGSEAVGVGQSPARSKASDIVSAPIWP